MRHDECAGHTLRGDAAGGHRHKVGVQNGTIQVPIADELAGEENIVGLVKAQGLIDQYVAEAQTLAGIE